MKKMFVYFRKFLPVIAMVTVFLLMSHAIYARAGGAGGVGGSGSGSSDDGDGVSDLFFDIIDLAFQNPLLGIIAILVFILIFYFTKIKNKY